MAVLTAAGAKQILRERFAPWIQDLGLEFDSIEPGRIRIRLPYSDRLARSGGMICGQALMAVADIGMVLAPRKVPRVWIHAGPGSMCTKSRGHRRVGGQGHGAALQAPVGMPCANQGRLRPFSSGAADHGAVSESW